MPATAGVQLMMKTLARSCNLSPNCSFEKLRDTVLNHLDKNTLVIVDEIHQAMLSYHKQARVTCLELLREIHDRTHCGMVLCGTNVFREEIQRGKDKEMLDQLQRRGIVQLQLPRRPPVRDLDAVAKAFGLPPAEGEARELMKTIIHESGLGKFVKFLQAASRYSNKTKTKLDWKHFVHAHDAFAKLSERDAV